MADTIRVELDKRAREGSRQSAQWTVPANATGFVRLFLDLDLSDAQDPSFAYTWAIFVLQGGAWRQWASATAQGSRTIDARTGQQFIPSHTGPVAELRGCPVRAEVSTSRRVSWGCKLVTMPEWTD